MPSILSQSRRLSGKQLVYETFGDELQLTVYAAYAADFGTGGAA